MWCSPLNQSVLALLFCLILTQAALCEHSLPVFRVDTTGRTSLQIGQALGSVVKQQFPDIEARYDAYLHTILTQAQFDQMQQQRVNRIRSQVDATYQDEIAGIISRWQLFGHDQLGDGRLSLNEYWTWLLLPDLNHPKVQGSAFGVWHSASATDSPLIGRNLDWPGDANLRGLQAITVYAGPENSLVNIGFAGYIGVLSGFNQSGLFLAQIASPVTRSGIIPAQPDSVVFTLRRTLETTGTSHQAARQLIRYRYPASHSIVMADRISIQVLEKPQDEVARIRTDHSVYRADKPWGRANQIAVVNCYVLARAPDNCTHSRDNFLWQRFSQLATFDRLHPAETRDIINIMLDTANHRQAIFNQRTLQALVFTPEDSTLHLYHTPPSGQGSERPLMQAFRNLLPAQQTRSWDSLLIILVACGLCGLITIVYYLEFHRKRDS